MVKHGFLLPHMPGYPVATRSTGKYRFVNTEASDLVARFTVQPSNARKRQIDTLVGSLESAGVWPKLDGLYVEAAHASQAGTRNWIEDAYNLTEAGGAVFAVDRGFTGDNNDARLLSGYVPSTAGGNMTLNSTSIFMWSLTGGAAANTGALDISTTLSGDRSQLRARGSDDVARWNVNDQTTSSVASTDGSGFFIMTRASSTNRSLRRNKTEIHAPAVNSTGLPATEIAFLAQPGGFGGGSRQIAASGFGSALTSGESDALCDALFTYLTAVGAV